MALSAFADRDQSPSEAELARVLGEAAAWWNELISAVRSEFDPIVEEWTFSGKQWGWALRLKHRKRAVLYMTPSQESFHVGFALGEKAVAASRRSGLPRSVVELIEESTKYVEGRAVRLEVRNRKDLAHVVAVARIKMAN